MSEKLTVAELLARNGRKEDSAEAGRPKRRRRSLEDGGVSVAELTGSIPVVEDSADSDAAASRTEGAVAGKKAEPSVKPAAGAAAKAGAGSAAAAASSPSSASAKPSIKKVRPVPQTKVAPVERPEEKTGKLAAVDEDPKKPQKIEDIERAQKPGVAASAKPEAGKKQPGAASAKPAAAAVKEEPKNAVGDSAAAKAATQKAPQKSTQKAEQAEAVATPAKRADKQGAPFKKKKGALGAAGTAADRGEVETAERPSSKTEQAKDSAVTPEEFQELEANLAEDEVLEYEDDRISWPAMLAQALAAIVAGVGVFFAFSLLWDKAPGALVLVLALAVPLVMVGLVHALLRHRDKLLMILAFFVGLVLTIGPRLILGM